MLILDITCAQLAPFLRILNYLIKILQVSIPLVLIVLIIYDFTKAILANDEKRMNDAKQVVVKRIIYALIIFLVPTIVSLLFRQLGSVGGEQLNSATDWISCYNRFIR